MAQSHREIEALFNGLDASVFDDQDQDDQDKEDGFLRGSAEVPAESQSVGFEEDEEQYWGRHTQEEDQLLIQATQAYDPPSQAEQGEEDLTLLDASAFGMGLGGFQTGAGKNIAQPSSQAQRKAQHLLQSSPPPSQDRQLVLHHANNDHDEDDEDSQNLMPPPPVPFHHEQESEHEAEAADTSVPAFEISFKSARGSALAGPSEEAMARAKSLLEPSPSPQPQSQSQGQPPTPSPAVSQHDRPVQSTPNAAHTPLRPSPLLHRQQAQPGKAHLTPATPNPEHPLRLMPPPQMRTSSSPLPVHSLSLPHLLNRQPQPQPSPQTVPRVQSQMHGCAKRQVPRKQFKTPFKNGVRPPPGALSQQRPSPARIAESGALVVRSANDGNQGESQTSGALILSNGQALSGARQGVRSKQGKYRAVFDLYGMLPFSILYKGGLMMLWTGSEGERVPWRDAAFVLGLSSVALEALGMYVALLPFQVSM